MVDLGQFSHDLYLTFMLWYLIQHLLLHELHSDDPVFAEVVALEHHSVVTLAQLLRTIDVEIVVYLLHALHRGLYPI
jgi:hypothetical protein